MRKFFPGEIAKWFDYDGSAQYEKVVVVDRPYANGTTKIHTRRGQIVVPTRELWEI